MRCADQRTSREPNVPPTLWTRAEFPNAVMRAEFLEQVTAWNRIEDLPQIHTKNGVDTRSLRYWCADYRTAGLRKLVAAYGGRVTFEADSVQRLKRELIGETFACDWDPNRTASG